MHASRAPLVASRKLHALVLPMPAPGHINPMLNFSVHLALRGFVITFINTEKAQDRIKSQSQHSAFGLDVRFATIPGGYQEPPLPGQNMLDAHHSIQVLLEGIASQQGLLEEMVINSRATPHPITCIIADSFFPWTQPLASKLGIKGVLFWTTNGMGLASTLEMRSGKFRIPDVDDPNDTDLETGGIILKRSELVAALPFRGDPEHMKHFKERLNGIEHTACIVVNTLEELEAASLKASTCPPAHVRYVGPILPPHLDHTATLSASFYHEDSECLSWLDKQEMGSVLYISFGSMASLTPHQVEEFAAGIEGSKQPFLWVARDGTDLFPTGFIERTHGLGLIIQWAPQIQVLAHAAVGGFLTHCGWNSVLESIHMGVPMLCYPVFADQHLNALLITKVWKLGVAIQMGEDGLIQKDNVQKAIMALMHSQDLQQRAATWKAACHRALEQGGSSDIALESFIIDVTTVA